MKADGDSFDSVFRSRLMPLGPDDGTSGGPNGLSDLHGCSGVTDWTCFFCGDSVLDILWRSREFPASEMI